MMQISRLLIFTQGVLVCRVIMKVQSSLLYARHGLQIQYTKYILSRQNKTRREAIATSDFLLTPFLTWKIYFLPLCTVSQCPKATSKEVVFPLSSLPTT